MVIVWRIIVASFVYIVRRIELKIESRAAKEYRGRRTSRCGYMVRYYWRSGRKERSAGGAFRQWKWL